MIQKGWKFNFSSFNFYYEKVLSIFMKSIRMKVVVLFILFVFSFECISQENKNVIHDFFENVKAEPPLERFLYNKTIIENLYIDDLICDENDSLYIRFSFVIEKEGNLTDFRMRNFKNQVLSEQQMESRLKNILNALGKWTPATSQGKAVRSRYTLPLKINCS